MSNELVTINEIKEMAERLNIAQSEIIQRAMNDLKRRMDSEV